jgi:hypothetical protein
LYILDASYLSGASQDISQNRICIIPKLIDGEGSNFSPVQLLDNTYVENENFDILAGLRNKKVEGNHYFNIFKKYCYLSF